MPPAVCFPGAAAVLPGSGLGLLQDERGLAPLPSVREGVIHLIGVELFQSVLIISLHGLVDQNRATAIHGIKTASREFRPHGAKESCSDAPPDGVSEVSSEIA